MSGFTLNRLPRNLSAFDHATQRWAAIPLRASGDPITQKRPSHPPADAVGKQSLTLTTWNVQASQSGTTRARSKLILDHILKGPKLSDMIFSRKSLPAPADLSLTIPEPVGTGIPRRPFANMTLLSNKLIFSAFVPEEGSEIGRKLMLDDAFRMVLPSRYGRDAICVDIAAPAAPGTIIRLLNVHFDSFDSPFRRLLEMADLAAALRELRCSAGVIAGDFNAIEPKDHERVDEHELLDAWVALHGSTGADGATWGVGTGSKPGREPARLDKVVMLGLKPDEIEILQPGLIGSHTPWSSHCGLRCTFTL